MKQAVGLVSASSSRAEVGCARHTYSIHAIVVGVFFRMLARRLVGCITRAAEGRLSDKRGADSSRVLN